MVNLSWDTQSDLDGERDIAGMVHDGSQDHPGTGILASGYNYHTIEDLYTVLYGSDLVGWWPLHESSGQANDLSGQGNHGSVSGATQGVGGRGGLQAYSFDGSDDNVVIPHSSELEPTNITFSAWARSPNSTWDDRGILSKRNGTNNGYLIHPESSSADVSLYVRVGGSWYSVIVTPSDATKWNLYTATYDGNTLRGYLNGSEAATNQITGSIDYAQEDLFIGEDQGIYVAADICDVRVYSRVLTPTQIQSLYDWGSGDYAVPPDNNDNGVSYYNFNSANANDQWGSNDGTVNGASHQASGGPREDGAYSFDGSDDDIDLGFSTLVFPGTLSFWIKLDSFNSFSHYFSNYDNTSDDFFISDRDSGGPWGLTADNYPNINPAGSFTLGSWYHVAVVVDGSEVIAYQNGAPVGRASTTNTSNVDNAHNFSLMEDQSNSRNADGQVDEVRIYDRALEPWEIQELYQYGTLGRSLLEHTVNL